LSEYLSDLNAKFDLKAQIKREIQLFNKEKADLNNLFHLVIIISLTNQANFTINTSLKEETSTHKCIGHGYQ
jgi:hypothetical protein